MSDRWRRWSSVFDFGSRSMDGRCYCALRLLRQPPEKRQKEVTSYEISLFDLYKYKTSSLVESKKITWD